MLKVKVYAVAKSKQSWLQQALSEYEKRLAPLAEIHWIFPKNNSDLLTAVEEERGWIALDVQGEMPDSVALSQKLMKLFVQQGSRLTFLLGGAEGIPAQLLDKALWRWSLSPLTFTHQIARLIFLEQLYRAFEIAKGSPYHK